MPFQVLLMLALVALFVSVVRKTLFGQYLLITGGNERAGYLCGVPTATVKLIVCTLCASLTGLAVELAAIAAVAVGGTALTGGNAYIGGTLIGALIIQLLRYALLAHGIPDAPALVVKTGIIVAPVNVQRRSR